MGAPTISPVARNTHSPPSLTITRAERAILVDGISRGMIWDGIEGTAWKLGIEKPGTHLVADDTGGGSVSASSQYWMAYRYLDKYMQPGDLSEFATLTTSGAANHRIDHTGISNSANKDRIKFIQIFRSLAGDSSVVYLVVTLGHHGTVVSSADNGSGFTRFVMGENHNLEIGARITVTGHSTITGTYKVTAVIDETTVDVGQAYAGSDGTGGNWVIEGYVDEDDLPDTGSPGLDDQESLAILDDQNHRVARRFGMPPTFMSVAITFQDRTIYGVPLVYDKGTIATNGTTTITGTGTDWNEDMVDRWLRVPGESRLYRIDAYVSATELTLADPVANTASGLSYSIAPHWEFRNKHIVSAVDEPESCEIDPSVTTYGDNNGFTNLISIQENTSDAYDRETALMPFTSAYYSFRQRHIYEITFVRQPDIDHSAMCVGYRGCLNQRCWVIYEGIAYVLDEFGAYAFDGQNIKPLSDAIQNYWRDGNIKHTNGKWFHVACDRQLGVIRFFVQFSTDTGTRPKQALCYHVISGTWWREYYPWEVGQACLAIINGVTRLLVGAEDDKIYLTHEGNVDVATNITYDYRSGMMPLAESPDHTRIRREVVCYYEPTLAAHVVNFQIYADRNVNPEANAAHQTLDRYFYTTKGSSQWKLDMIRTRTVQGQSRNVPGIAGFAFGGTLADGTYGTHYVAIDVQGVQTTSDNIKIYGIDVWGVQDVTPERA